MDKTTPSPPHRRTWAPLLLACLGAALATGGRPAQAAPEPITVERFGALELLGQNRGESGGDAAQHSPQRVPTWRLRWQGQPLSLQTPAGLWGDRLEPRHTLHAVWLLEPEGAATPELLVLAGDPNNTAGFHRLRVAGDRLHATLVCITRAGDNAVALLDGGAPVTGPQRTLLRLPAGRAAWLQLGQRCLHDAASGQTRLVAAAPEGLAFPAYWGASSIAPDGSQLARVAVAGRDGLRGVVAQAPLPPLPAGLVAGSVESLRWLQAQPLAWRQRPIDALRLEVPRFDAIDATWLQRHWRWQRREGGWQLVERSNEALAAAPAAVVQHLLEAHFAGEPAFTARDLARTAPWLTPALLAALEQELGRNTGDEAPEINGDVFTDTQEPPSRFSVGSARLQGDSAEVPVRFDSAHGGHGLLMRLHRGEDGWRVDDIVDRRGASLRALLRQLQRR